MRSSVFGKWTISHPVKAHIVLPAILGFALVALYFSTVPFLQDLVAPGSGRPPPFTLAGRGLLELLEVFLLLCVFFFLVRCLVIGRGWLAQLWLLFLLLGTAAVFMEEVDFGTSLVGLILGQGDEAFSRGQDAASPMSGETVAGYVKLAGNAMLLLFFFLAPLLLGNSRSRTLRLLAPSMWTLATVAVVLAMDRFAHSLDNAGLGTIDGLPGPLAWDLAEFRELLIYYLVLIYAAGLHERVVVRHQALGR